MGGPAAKPFVWQLLRACMSNIPKEERAEVLGRLRARLSYVLMSGVAKQLSIYQFTAFSSPHSVREGHQVVDDAGNLCWVC